MSETKIVQIMNPERYSSLPKEYGILQYSLPETAVINFDSNRGGHAINIHHQDYRVLPSCMYEIKSGKVWVCHNGEYIDSGLMVWSNS